jgi:tetratricopeptide (TPR) repeat protein
MRRWILVATTAVAGCGHSEGGGGTRIVVAQAAPANATADADATTDAAPAEPPDPATDPAVTPPPEGDAAAASRHEFELGERAYLRGDYGEAIARFRRAYEFWPDPAFLYNLAQAHRLLGQVRDALFFYKRFLKLDPDAPNRSYVEGRIVELEALLAP